MGKTVTWIVMQGPAQFIVVLVGWLQLVACTYLHVGWQLLPGCGAPLLFWSPLELMFPPLELVLLPLECALLAVLLGLRKLCCTWSWPLLPCFLPMLFGE